MAVIYREVSESLRRGRLVRRQFMLMSDQTTRFKAVPLCAALYSSKDILVPLQLIMKSETLKDQPSAWCQLVLQEFDFAAFSIEDNRHWCFNAGTVNPATYVHVTFPTELRVLSIAARQRRAMQLLTKFLKEV